MPLKVEKQSKESSQNLVRRFTQKIKKSGILLEARRKLFHQREKSWKRKKESALRREQKKKEYENLKKSGKI